MDSCYNPFSLAGKSVLVTGASSGIGRATAIACSRMHASVIACGRNQDRLDETMASLYGDEHSSVAIDLNDSAAVESMVAGLPPLDGIVLAAGIVEMKPFMFATKEKFNKIYDTNLFSPVQLIRLLVKKKRFNKGFSVVTVSSVAGHQDIVPGNGIYGSGKSALSSLMKYAALELAAKGIRINTISPGMILTPMHTQGDISQDQLDAYISKVPMSAWGTPEDVALAAVYLLSDASSYLTGSDIKVDGGLTI